MFEYDVFLSHSGADKSAVEAVAQELQKQGLRVFFDAWELVPGTHWQDALLEALAASRTCAVFLGARADLGPWHSEEMRVALGHRVAGEPKRVIPVLLPAAEEAAIPAFLAQRTWVDLRGGLDDKAAVETLVAGIRGSAPSQESSLRRVERIAIPEEGARDQRHRPLANPPWWRRNRFVNWGISLGILGVVLTAFPRAASDPAPSPAPTPIPDLYALRVQVTDPDGRPLEDSRIRVSSGNEPHLLPDGWWQIEIPRAKVPLDGQITLWAEHPQWKGTRTVLSLGEDPNPQAEVRLETPRERIAGVVVDAQGRSIAGAQVSVRDQVGASASTNQAGQFELWVRVARDAKARLYVEHAEFQPHDGSCFAGRDGCVLVMEPQP